MFGKGPASSHKVLFQGRSIICSFSSVLQAVTAIFSLYSFYDSTLCLPSTRDPPPTTRRNPPRPHLVKELIVSGSWRWSVSFICHQYSLFPAIYHFSSLYLLLFYGFKPVFAAVPTFPASWSNFSDFNGLGRCLGWMGKVHPFITIENPL